MADYKGYTLSKTINGIQLFYIARNRGGAIAFRETTEEKLLKAIDASVKAIEKAEEELAKKKIALEKKAKRGRQLFQAKKDFEKEIKKDQGELAKKEEEITKKVKTTGVARGPHGRFLSKKKSFWEKLKG